MDIEVVRDPNYAGHTLYGSLSAALLGIAPHKASERDGAVLYGNDYSTRIDRIGSKLQSHLVPDLCVCSCAHVGLSTYLLNIRHLGFRCNRYRCAVRQDRSCHWYRLMARWYLYFI